jgi:thioredoxin-related protein
LKTNCKTCSILNSSKYGKKLKNHLKFREIIDSVIYIYIIYIKKNRMEEILLDDGRKNKRKGCWAWTGSKIDAI